MFSSKDQRSRSHDVKTSKIWRRVYLLADQTRQAPLHTKPTPLLGLLYCRRLRPCETGRAATYNVGVAIFCFIRRLRF